MLLIDFCKLHKKNQELKKYEYEIQKLNSLQYLTNKDKKQIRIIQRILELKLINKDEYNRFQEIIFINHNGEKFKAYHLKKDAIKIHLMNISKKINSTKKKQHNQYAKIERNKRTNIYIKKDYEDFGDMIIKQYFKDIPFDTW